MDNKNLSLDKIVKFASKNGFVFPSSEIYGGFSASYDFGPLGSILKRNLVDSWREWNIVSRIDTEEIEGSIFLHPKVWEASGHIGGFSDLLVEDLVTNKRYRADHLIEDSKVNFLDREEIIDNAGALSSEEIDRIIEFYDIKSPEGNPLSKSKKFNLLVKTHLGPVENDSSIAYLKGESCQNIYLDWKLVQETTRRKLPFGIAQLGKAFRNEITVKQFLFRTREFEQIDLQYFIKPDEFKTKNDKSVDEWYQYWKNNRWEFYTQFLGVSEKNLKYRQHNQDELVFYALDAWDIEYRFGELGFKEMEGVHNRTSYDTDQHSKFSKKDLSYFDPENNKRYNPYIIEMSAGINRMFLMLLFEFFEEEKISDTESRIVFRLPYKLAPYKLAILPLMKKDGLKEKAEEIYVNLRKKGILVTYDEAGSIGKRYRRQDEIGTPWCITIDYETKEDYSVTIRHRDTMEQKRVKVSELEEYITKF